MHAAFCAHCRTRQTRVASMLQIAEIDNSCDVNQLWGVSEMLATCVWALCCSTDSSVAASIEPSSSVLLAPHNEACHTNQHQLMSMLRFAAAFIAGSEWTWLHVNKRCM